MTNEDLMGIRGDAQTKDGIDSASVDRVGFVGLVEEIPVRVQCRSGEVVR